MNVAETSELLEKISTGEVRPPFQDDVLQIQLLSPLATGLFETMPTEVLEALSDGLIAGRHLELTPTVVGLLHTYANLHRAHNNILMAMRVFSRILLHTPNDQNVRVGLFEYYYSNKEIKKACEVLEPAIDALFQNTALYGKNIKQYIIAEFLNSNYSTCLTVISKLYINTTDAEIKKIQDRINMILEICPSTLKNILTNEQEYFNNAFNSLSEYEMLGHINVIKEKVDIKAKKNNRIDCLLVIIYTCISNGWTRAFRQATELLYICAPIKDDLSKSAKAAGIPAKIIDAINAYMKAAHEKHPAPVLDSSLSFDSMLPYWQQMFREGAFTKLSARIPPVVDGGESEVTKLSTQTRTLSWLDREAEKPSANIWYFIAWQNNNEQLFRLIHGLIHPGNRYVTSIGGDRLPEDVADTSALLLVDGVHFLYRPVVTWGGQKLLYINLFEVLKAFDANAAETDWFQSICNRTYPLISAREAGQKLYGNKHVENYPSHLAVPSWHQEWSPEVVENLPAVFDDAIDDIFGEANTTGLRALAYDHMRYMSSVFNFSADYQPLEASFKASKHNYNVSPFGLDIRWMSFARLIEFVDVATETSDTFTRRLDPMVMQWVHRVLKKHDLRIGDPFVTINKKYADVVLHNPEAVELFAAMNLGFGPEMNYFDTVRASPQYDLMADLAHLYYRNVEYVATEPYIAEAEQSIEQNGSMLIRKTVPEGAGFVKYFAEKNALGMSDGSHYYASSEAREPADSHLFPALELILPLLIGKPVTIRDLNNEIKYNAVLTPDGLIVDGERRLGGWRLTDGNLVIYYEADHYGEKTYTSLSASALSLIAAPAELVSYRNRWSLFLEWSFKDLPNLANDEIIWQFTDSVQDKACEWHVATHKDVAMMSAFEKQAYAENPSAVDRQSGAILAIRRLAENTVYLAKTGDCPVLLKLDRISRTWDQVAKTFSLADSHLASLWDTAPDYQPSISLKAGDLAGHIVIKVLEGEERYTIESNGTISDAEGKACGHCGIVNGAVWFFGLKNLRLALASQISHENGEWVLCGWGWKNFKDRTTFRVTFNR